MENGFGDFTDNSHGDNRSNNLHFDRNFHRNFNFDDRAFGFRNEGRKTRLSSGIAPQRLSMVETGLVFGEFRFSNRDGYPDGKSI